jgi:hypothetical protein
VPRGLGFSHHSRTISVAPCPNPNITIRNFFIAVHQQRLTASGAAGEQVGTALGRSLVARWVRYKHIRRLYDDAYDEQPSYCYVYLTTLGLQVDPASAAAAAAATAAPSLSLPKAVGSVLPGKL